MATIAENLQTIKNSTAAIKKAILDKGGTISGDITTWAGAIDGIQTGGGGSSPSRPTYTGHADVEGLKAIGWTDEDIAYYQANGVNWNEEDDQYHKVPENNIALYGMIRVGNISSYKDRIVYLPKIDTSGVTDMSYKFSDCRSLVFIPHLDTSSVTNMNSMFNNCPSLVSIPQLDTSGVTDMSNMFYYCHSLVSIPQLDTSSVTSIYNMFNYCHSLVSIPQLDTSGVTNMNSMFYNCYSLVSIPQLNTSSVTSMKFMFYNCYSLVSIPQLNTSGVTNMSSMFYNCYSIQTVYLNDINMALEINSTSLLTKESLLYIINNEAATTAITIKLSTYCYNKYSADADVVAALSNHPNISLAK